MNRSMRDLPDELSLLGGGTGTPKLLWHIQDHLDPESLTVIANTGDDVEFGDLFVSPDIDTCLFTAAGRIDSNRWWGIEEDPTTAAESLATYSSAVGVDAELPRYRTPEEQESGRYLSRWRRFEPVPEFMTFGDEDRAIHRARAAALDRGRSLTDITRDLGEYLGSPIDIIPMSDDPVATWIDTEQGSMHFQDFWVARGGDVPITSVEFRGSETARPTTAVLDALDADVVVIGPSNPVTSLGPILSLPGVRSALDAALVIAVSPFLNDTAFSGPAADLMEATGLPIGTAGLENAYPFLDALVVDSEDESDFAVPAVSTDILISTPDDVARIWGAISDAIERIR